MVSTKEDKPAELTEVEISLSDLAIILGKTKWLIGGITTAVTLVALVLALSLPNVYVGTAVLASTEQSDSAVGGMVRQYSGLASLAGVSLPGGADASKVKIGIQLLRSRSFVADFVDRRDILPDLMAYKRWNSDLNTNEYDPKIYDAVKKIWVRDVSPPKQARPTPLEAHKELMRILSISENSQTGFVTVSIKHESPIIAAKWVTWLVEDVNEELRRQDVLEASHAIQYLNEQIDSTSLADLQAVFFEMIQTQTEKIMLAEVRPEYVFKTLDPAVPPEEKNSPNRSLILIFGFMLGLVGSVVMVFIRHLEF